MKIFFAFSKTCKVQNGTIAYNFSVRIKRKKENEIINRNINNKRQLLQRYLSCASVSFKTYVILIKDADKYIYFEGLLHIIGLL